MLLESSIPPAVYSFPGTGIEHSEFVHPIEFKFSITVSLNLTLPLPLYYQLENGVIDQHGVILDRTNLDYHHLLQSETFMYVPLSLSLYSSEGQDMNPSMENMILPSEDFVLPPEDLVPPLEDLVLPLEKFDFSLENFDLPEFSIEIQDNPVEFNLESQDGVDEPEDSMQNTSEAVPQEEPEVPLEEEAKADIDSDINEYINDLLKEDLLSEPYEPSFLAMDH